MTSGLILAMGHYMCCLGDHKYYAVGLHGRCGGLLLRVVGTQVMSRVNVSSGHDIVHFVGTT